MTRNRHFSACVGLIVVMIIGAIVSMAAGWPAQFGGEGDSDKVASEFFTRGTALAPPFVPLLFFVMFTILARRADRWGTAAIVGTMLLSILFIVGSLGEAFAASTPDVPRIALITSGVAGAVLSGAVLLTAGQLLRQRAQLRRNAAL